MNSLAPSVLTRSNDFRPFIPDASSVISTGITTSMRNEEIQIHPLSNLTDFVQQIFDALRARLTATVRMQELFDPLRSRFDALGLTTQVDFTLAALADTQKLFEAIQDLYQSNNLPRDRQIAQRITVLHQDALAEDQHILPRSLRQFADFFLAHPRLGLPKITLTPDGTLRARWIRGPADFVAIEFTGEPLAKLISEIPRGGNLTAAHFSREPLSNIVSVASSIGASFT